MSFGHSLPSELVCAELKPWKGIRPTGSLREEWLPAAVPHGAGAGDKSSPCAMQRDVRAREDLGLGREERLVCRAGKWVLDAAGPTSPVRPEMDAPEHSAQHSPTHFSCLPPCTSRQTSLQPHASVSLIFKGK